MDEGEPYKCEWSEFLMADYITNTTELTSIANAIRTKGGTSASLTYPTGFVAAINAIPTGGGDGWEDITNEFTIDGEYSFFTAKRNPDLDAIYFLAICSVGSNGLPTIQAISSEGFIPSEGEMLGAMVTGVYGTQISDIVGASGSSFDLTSLTTTYDVDSTALICAFYFYL